MELISLDFRELMVALGALVAVCGWLFRLEAAVRAANKTAVRAEEKIDKTDHKLEDKLDQLRKESNDNFAAINATLQQVIFRIGEKRDRSE